jgi:hypothetical protein
MQEAGATAIAWPCRSPITGRGHRDRLAVPEPDHLSLRADVDAAAGPDAAIGIDHGVERGRLVEPVLERERLGLVGDPLLPPQVENDGNDGDRGEHDARDGDQGGVRHQKIHV